MAVTEETLLRRIEELEQRVGKLEGTKPALGHDWPVWPATGKGPHTLGDCIGILPELAQITDEELESCLIRYKDAPEPADLPGDKGQNLPFQLPAQAWHLPDPIPGMVWDPQIVLDREGLYED